MTRRRIRTSRLVRTSEKQNKRQALFFTVGIIALILILLQFGPVLINLFGNIVYTLRGGDKADQAIVAKELLQPPLINGLSEATQSSKISFSGTVQTNGTVEIYINDDLKNEVEATTKNRFSSGELPVRKGNNTIKVRLVSGDKTSAFSQDYEVSYISDKPKLEVSFPSDGNAFTKADKTITVTGTTDADNTVTVNSFRAIVESDGKFSYVLQLNDGENQISVEAQNSAGVTTQKSLKVTYSP